MRFSAMVLICLLMLSPAAAGQKTIDASPLEINPLENSSKVQREVFDIAKYPALTAVGRINFIGQSWCSIILVAEDLAVTAGHCFLKANYKFNLSKDLNPFYTTVIFKPNGVRKIENVSVQRVLKANMNPDYAIVRLNKKIPESVIKPLHISNLTIDEMRASEANLGCAAFNGDRELGSGGLLLTISRNIKIIPENSSTKRIDTTCFSTYGGSGGLFYRAHSEAENGGGEYDFLGVIWGLTDEKLNEKGEWVKDENVVTSITPVGSFYDELTAIIKKENSKSGKNRIED